MPLRLTFREGWQGDFYPVAKSLQNLPMFGRVTPSAFPSLWIGKEHQCQLLLSLPAKKALPGTVPLILGTLKTKEHLSPKRGGCLAAIASISKSLQ